MNLITILMILNGIFAMYAAIHPKTTAGKVVGFAVLFTTCPAVAAFMGVYARLFEKNNSLWILLGGSCVSIMILSCGICLSWLASYLVDKRA